MVKVMGIDYSANFTGVVYDGLQNKSYWFTSTLKRDRDNCFNCTFLPKDLNTVEKVDTICNNIFGIINESRPDLVAIESPAFMGSNQTAEFQDGYAIIKYVLRTMGISYILVPPISLKLFASGNAKGEKIDVAQGLKRDYGCDYFEVTSHWDNLFDAEALYRIASCYSTPEIIPELQLYKQQVLYGLLGDAKKLKEVKKLRQKEGKSNG